MWASQPSLESRHTGSGHGWGSRAIRFLGVTQSGKAVSWPETSSELFLLVRDVFLLPFSALIF